MSMARLRKKPLLRGPILNTDPFYRAEQNIGDCHVAQGTYEAVIVFTDGKGNVNDERRSAWPCWRAAGFLQRQGLQIASSSAWSRTRERLVAKFPKVCDRDIRATAGWSGEVTRITKRISGP